MEARQYTTIDKSGWGRGEWQDEPDKMQWQDEATGLPCLIVRGPSGALCGYVGVAPDHPLHGKDYDHVDVSVHGGLTFSDRCADSADESRGICHVAGEGEPDHVWWFGFDCAHLYDHTPAYERHWGSGEDIYRDLAYVQSEVTSLARQLAATP